MCSSAQLKYVCDMVPGQAIAVSVLCRKETGGPPFSGKAGVQEGQQPYTGCWEGLTGHMGPTSITEATTALCELSIISSSA